MCPSHVWKHVFAICIYKSMWIYQIDQYSQRQILFMTQQKTRGSIWDRHNGHEQLTLELLTSHLAMQVSWKMCKQGKRTTWWSIFVSKSSKQIEQHLISKHSLISTLWMRLLLRATLWFISAGKRFGTLPTKFLAFATLSSIGWSLLDRRVGHLHLLSHLKVLSAMDFFLFSGINSWIHGKLRC